VRVKNAGPRGISFSSSNDDAEIETALRGAEDLRTQMGESPIRQRLAALRRPA
jgi:hypothetical protein